MNGTRRSCGPATQGTDGLPRRVSGRARRSRRHRSAAALMLSIAGVLTSVAGCGGADSGSPATTASPVTTTAPGTSAPAGVVAAGPNASTTLGTADSAPPVTSAPPATTAAPPQIRPADPRAERPYAVDVRTETFVDDSRPTTFASGESVPSRTLETTIYLPRASGPAPLIVFSHGFGGSPAKFERLLGAWASAGYAVAAITFPLTNDTLPESERVAGDVTNQAGDVVFVLDQLLAGDLAARFDPARLAAAGLSLGGLTTYMAAIDATTGDPRFRAAVVLAAVPPRDTFVAAHLPVLVMHGELDPVVPLGLASATFAKLNPPAYEVTLLGAFHAEAFEDAKDNTAFADPGRFHPVVDATTTAFWDTYLLADPAAAAQIATATDVPGVATLEARTGD